MALVNSPAFSTKSSWYENALQGSAVGNHLSSVSECDAVRAEIRTMGFEI